MLGQMTWNHAGWHNLVIIPNPSCGVLGGIMRNRHNPLHGYLLRKLSA